MGSFTTIQQFTSVWKEESQKTATLLELLTDGSLAQPKMDNIRSLGRMAWHIVCAMPEMCNRFGIPLDGPSEKDPIPTDASAIHKAYLSCAKSVLAAVESWSENDLKIEDDMYGMTWTRGTSLWVLLVHEIHHRAQMTILMRLAGLKVKGIYGPSKEEWSQFNMPAPEV